MDRSPVSTSTAVSTVGIIGGGQLAWMMAAAAAKLGIHLVIQTPSQDDPAVAIAHHTIFAPIADAQATAQMATQCDVITFENEFVDLPALKALEATGVCFRPRLAVLEPLLDKYHQRSLFRQLDLPTPDFWPLEALHLSPQYHPTDLTPALTWPLVLKTRRHGYDGQGTFVCADQTALTQTLQRLPAVPFLVEAFVPFERELAIMAARSHNGEIVLYPVVETVQEAQVCRRVFVPAAIPPAVSAQVAAIARTLLTHLEVVGIFGIELFLTADHQVLVNEIAPRTHNSGHFSLDACNCSQFEQHLRAVAGFPLVPPTLKTPGAVMVNLLGYEQSFSDYQAQRKALAALPAAFVHWYGKAESRPGRKLGHVTVLLPASERSLMAQATAMAQKIESIWYPTHAETSLH